MTKYVIIILFDSVNQVELIDTVKGFSSMNENIESSQKFPMRPVAPLGVIAMNGCEEMGRKVNEFLKNWQVDASSDQKPTASTGQIRTVSCWRHTARASAPARARA